MFNAIQKTASEIETISIDFTSIDNGANINFSWDDIMFFVPVEIN